MKIMKQVVVVSKVGGVFYTRALATKNSKVGEQGETEGIVKHLLKRDDIQVVYFGQWRGDIPDGMIYIESSIDGLDEYSLAAEQQRHWDLDIQNIQPYSPLAYINIAGYASTLSMIKNPNAASIQVVGIRYCAPALNVMQQLKIPRIVINNDPRNYPQDGEMSFNWDWTRPRALLSQRAAEWSKVIQNKKYAIREVYAAAENWCEYIREEPINDIPCACIAHAHIGDGCKELGRDIAFAHILAPRSDIKELVDEGFVIHGEGWKCFCNYDPSYMLGSIRPNEVSRLLAHARTCPAVAAGNEFYTSKLRTCLAQGALPLFYGRGEPYTFDCLGKYLPLDHELRIAMPGDLLKAVRYLDKHEQERRNLIDELWRISSPDFSLLDKCIDDIIDGRDMETESWWKDYGGYR